MTINCAALLVADFVQVAQLAGHPLEESEINIELLASPHTRPTRFPSGCMAVYVFGIGDVCLKVGKAGPKTAQRYTYQHYNEGSAPSTLAASLLNHFRQQDHRDWTYEEPLDVSGIGAWIERNTWRANFLISSKHSSFLLNLLEAFLQARLTPIYEGHQSRSSR